MTATSPRYDASCVSGWLQSCSSPRTRPDLLRVPARAQGLCSRTKTRDISSSRSRLRRALPSSTPRRSASRCSRSAQQIRSGSGIRHLRLQLHRHRPQSRHRFRRLQPYAKAQGRMNTPPMRSLTAFAARFRQFPGDSFFLSATRSSGPGPVRRLSVRTAGSGQPHAGGSRQCHRRKWFARGRQRKDLTGLFTTYTANDPQFLVTIDREKAKSLHVPLQQITDTLGVYMGSPT